MSGYAELMEERIGDRTLKLCCRTCSSLRHTTSRLWAQSPYCNNPKKGSDVMNDEWNEVCEHWKPARWCVKTALDGGFKGFKQ